MFQIIKKQISQSMTLLRFGFLNALGQAFNMITPLILAKFFNPALFGRYSLSKMIIFLFISLFITSLRAPFIVFANQERTDNNKINRSFTVHCLFLVIGFVLFSIIFLIFNSQIRNFAQINLSELCFLLLAFTGIALKTFMCNLFLAINERIKNAHVEFTYGILNLSIIILFYANGQLDLSRAFLAFFISAIIILVIFYPVINFKLLFPMVLDKKYMADMFNFSKWAAIGAAAIYITNWGDNLVLRYFVSMEDIGRYNLGYSLFKGLLVLIALLNSYFLPFISTNISNEKIIANYLYKKRPLVLLASVTILLILLFAVPFMLNLIYGDKYAESATIFNILIIAALLSTYNVFYTPLFNALKKYRLLQAINVSTVVVNIILDILLVPWLGIYGTAAGTVTAYIFKTILFEYFFRKRILPEMRINS